ncbi:nuclease-related domain-containing protein [Komagataeibacter xylinus]|uniref:NERD domain-containing protein n=1 Tax=Komagataeibacter xylinus TaxID=28448 RepID=A0A857FQE5_KOMXY|nr:nuclease-related domain-containing protein [Komagataeibacter xylinus]QHC36386.1 NERD domain-containing protein [Komagataeibacter xylinus]
MTRAHRNQNFPAGEDAALWQQLCRQPAADDPVTQMLVASGLPVLHGITLPHGTDECVEIDHIFASADGLHTLHTKHYIAWINAPSSEKEIRSQGGAGNFACNDDFLRSFLKLAETVSTTINDPSLKKEEKPVPVTGHFLLPYKVPLVAPLRNHVLLIQDLESILHTLSNKGAIPSRYGEAWCHIATTHHRHRTVSLQIQQQGPA